MDTQQLIKYGLNQRENEPELKSPGAQCCVTSALTALLGIIGERLLSIYPPNKLENWILTIMNLFGKLNIDEFCALLGWPKTDIVVEMHEWASGNRRLVSTIAAFCAIHVAQHKLGITMRLPDFAQGSPIHDGGETWLYETGRPFLVERPTMDAASISSHFGFLFDGLGQNDAVVTMIRNTGERKDGKWDVIGHYNCVGGMTLEGLILKDPYGRHDLVASGFKTINPTDSACGTLCEDTWDELAGEYGQPQSRSLILSIEQ